MPLMSHEHRNPGYPFTVATQYEWCLRFDAKLDAILRSLAAMSTSAVTRAQLNEGIDTIVTTVHAERAAVTQAITDLKAKIDAGQVTTPEDFSAELDKITAAQAEAAQTTADVTAADPGVPTIPVTPPASGSDSSDGGTPSATGTGSDVSGSASTTTGVTTDGTNPSV